MITRTANNIRNDIQELAIFHVGEILCAVNITQVQEINKHLEITPAHLAPDYVRGVLNLRGQIVTVIDLRKKFGFPLVEINGDMRIVVVRSGTESIGLLVDGVEDIMLANAKDMDTPPSNVGDVTGTFFRSIYKMEEELAAVLNVEEVLKE